MTARPKSAGTRSDDGRKARSAARLAAVQALYQVDMNGQPAARVIEEFVRLRFGPAGVDIGLGPVDEAHFRRVVAGADAGREPADKLIAGSLSSDWTLERLDATLRAMLRAAIFELQGCADVPVAVVLSEYVDIAHAFHAGKEPAFVNGILDRIARVVREAEFAAAGAGSDGR
jgi:transcription antitermination protein NusB